MPSKYVQKVMYIAKDQARLLRKIQEETGIPQSKIIRTALKAALPKYKKFLKKK
jgi:hypothetical protein